MKTMALATRSMKLFALLLAVVMLFSACGGNENTSSEVPSDAVSDTVSTDSTDAEVADDTASKKPDTIASSKKNEGTTTNNQTEKEPTIKTGKTTWDKDYLSTLPKAVKDKGVHVLMWREYTKSESKLINDFQKKTGMKVRTTIAPENAYSTKLVSLVTAGDSPDVVQMGSTSFPGYITKAMQPLDKEIFRLDDACWYKTYMDAYSVNGKYYAVAMHGTWSCEDTNYVTYYIPDVLKSCGISTMPYDLYKNGQWNWDKELEYARTIKRNGKGITPLSWQKNILPMLTTGTDFISYDGKKFTNNLDKVTSSSLLTDAWRYLATTTDEGLRTGWNAPLVEQGKVGLFTAIAYGLYNEGEWFDKIPGGAGKMEAVPVAGPKGKTAYNPVSIKSWGVGKKAKNPEGAAYFLRYYLDAKNIDMSSTFYNKQFEKVFNIITDKNAKKGILMGEGAADYANSGMYGALCNAMNQTTPANVWQTLSKSKGLLDAGIKRANAELSRLK